MVNFEKKIIRCIYLLRIQSLESINHLLVNRALTRLMFLGKFKKITVVLLKRAYV
jgi:hypothetical protein